jgi:hypothetical protein
MYNRAGVGVGVTRHLFSQLKSKAVDGFGCAVRLYTTRRGYSLEGKISTLSRRGLQQNLIAMLQHSYELSIIEVAIVIYRTSLEHDINLLIGESISHGGHALPQVVSVDIALAVVVKSSESLQNFRFRVCA